MALEAAQDDTPTDTPAEAAQDDLAPADYEAAPEETSDESSPTAPR